MRRVARHSILALGGLALALGVARTGGAQVSMGPRVGAGLPEVRLVERNAEALGLDEKTLEAVKALAERAAEEDRKLGEALRDARFALRDLLDQQMPEQAALLAAADAVTEATHAVQKHQLETTLRLRALLTPEQRETLMELRKLPQQPPRRRRPG